MIKVLKAFVFRLMKVPPQPEPPAGAPGSVRVFRAARGYFFHRLVGWIVRQTSILVGLIVSFSSLRTAMPPDDLPGKVFWFFEILAVAGFVIQVPITFLMVSLDYKNRWYMVTDRSLRIREGINRVQERTMSFSNIQNIEIKQGPLQRFLDIADLEVRTAGGGDSPAANQGGRGQGDSMHLGYFRGVDNAGEIRQLISESLREINASGLGDPDEAIKSVASGESISPVLSAAKCVLGEVQALRGVLVER